MPKKGLKGKRTKRQKKKGQSTCGKEMEKE